MCINCVQNNIYSSNLTAFPYPSLSLIPGSVEKMPYHDVAGFEYNSESGAGNAVFDLEWSGGEFYVGKTVSISYMIEDADGFDQDNVTVEWYHFGNDTPIHVGNSFTLTNADLNEYITVVVKFTDNLGNLENWGDIVWSDPSSYKNLGQVISTPTEAPNTVRTTVSYLDFSNHIAQAQMSSHEALIEVLAETHQGKWGGSLGTAPTAITYSITPEGIIDYSDAQYDEHPLYADIENAGSASGLGASEFSVQDLTNIEIALDDWSSITGIQFVRDDTLGSKADLVFTKLDFAAWSTSSSWINPSSAGFAFQPGVGSDFLAGDIFLDADLSNGDMAGMSVRSVASHEIGHALGLAHPHDGYLAVGDGNSPYSEDLPNFNSVMSYDGTEFFQTSTPMMYDLWFMQALYGAPTTAITDDPYVVNIDEFIIQPGTSGNYYRAMLHDDGGNDSLTFVSNFITSSDDGIFVNLNKGSFSGFKSSTPITDLATITANANYQLSEFTEIETLTVTGGSDKINATVDWSVTVNSLGGDDQITTDGNNARIFGGDGNDTLVANITDTSLLYAEATSATSGSLKYKSNDALYCEATDIEFIRIIDNIGEQEFQGWEELAAQLLPPATGGTGTGGTGGTGGVYTPPSGEPSIDAPDLSGLTIYALDDTDGATGDAGVTEAGLYALRGDDTNGWDAYRLQGNAQQGWEVVEEVVDAFALEASFDNSTAGNVVAGTLGSQIVDIIDADNISVTPDDGGAAFNATGRYALVDDGAGAFDAYYVSGGNGMPFALGDLAYDSLFANAGAVTAATTAGMDVVGYLETAGSDSFAGGASAEKLFAIDVIADERYGNIITYGVRLIDGAAGESVTFDSLTFNVKWEADANSASYNFWGQFNPSDNAPPVGDVPASGTNPDVATTFFSDEESDGITFGMIADEGMKFEAGEYIATFMLDKTNSDAANELYLNTAQYTLYDATDMGGIKAPETPEYGTQGDSTDIFSFSYADHTVGLDLTNARGQEVENVELLVTDIAKGEGLSLVPIAKNGNLIQYQVVLNVPIPTFIQADTDNSVDIDTDYKIEISGADIFDESVTWLTDIAMGQTAQLTANVTPADQLVNGTPGGNLAGSNYSGHEFFDTILSALDPMDYRADLGDLRTSNSLVLEIDGIELPNVPSTDAEGRYILAEFTAISGATTAITYSSSQGTGGYGAASNHTITRISDSASVAASATTWDTTISDGSEAVVLANAIYVNEREFNDAIGAEDALGALKVSRDMAATAIDNNYSQAEIIAADFNMDGTVTSADAYDILHYAVHGPEPGTPVAQWVYIDQIASNTATSQMVEFDPVIDKFIGTSFDIDATGVLVGDVSSSYSGPPSSGYTTLADAVAAQIEAFDTLGISEMDVIFPDMTGTVTATAGRDLIFVQESGVYIIDDYASGVTNGKMSGDIVTVMGEFPTLTFATEVALGYDTSSTTVEPTFEEVIAAAVSNIDSTNNAVSIVFEDANTNVTDNTFVNVIAIDANGDDSFSTDDDLLIWANGSAIHYVDNPLDAEIFLADDFVVT